MLPGRRRDGTGHHFYSLPLPAAFAFFHRSFANADNLALPAALIFCLGFVPLILAHLAHAAAAIALLPAALILRLDFLAVPVIGVGTSWPRI